MINLRIRKFNLHDFLILYFCYEFISFLLFFTTPIGPKIITLVVFSLVVYMLITNDRIPINSGLIVMLIFASVSCFSIILQIILSQSVTDGKGFNSIGFIFKELLSIVLWFLFGYFFKKNHPSIFIAMLGVFVTLIFWNFVIISEFRFDYIPINFALNRMDIDHLHFSESIVLIAFYSMAAFDSNKVIKLFIFIYFSILLFVMGGKASFLFFILTSAIIFYDSRWRYVSLLFFGITFSVELYNFLTGYLSLENSSTFARLIFFYSAISNIHLFFLFGNIEWIVNEFSSVGGYSHNIISILQFYGIIPLIIVFYLSIIAVKNSLILKNKDLMFEKSLLAYSLISILLAKSGTFFLFWMALGIFSRAQKQN